jgi:hypothetical protein
LFLCLYNFSFWNKFSDRLIGVPCRFFDLKSSCINLNRSLRIVDKVGLNLHHRLILTWITKLRSKTHHPLQLRKNLCILLVLKSLCYIGLIIHHLLLIILRLIHHILIINKLLLLILVRNLLLVILLLIYLVLLISLVSIETISKRIHVKFLIRITHFIECF